MADKYLRQGETYCGDGTSSAAATSNGGVGAWNNINVLEGTAPAYGSLAAGDVVYIRSKTAAGADITRTLTGTTSLGSSAGTAASMVAWIIDGGTIWSGVSGTVTYETAGDYRVICLANNYIAAEVQDKLVFNGTNNWPGIRMIEVSGWVKNAKFISADTNSAYPAILFPPYSSGIPAVVENPTCVFARCNGPRIVAADNAAGRVINPDIRVDSTASNQAVFGLDAGYGPASLDIMGGRIYGVGATSTTKVFNVSEANYASIRGRIHGMEIPRSMPVCNQGITRNGIIELVGLDGGLGSHLEESWGWATTRTDNNPPTLSGALPDSTLTPWAWRIYPYAANFQKPVRLPAAKIYTDTAAVKTITLEFLVANTLSPTKKQAWITVQYIDAATGIPKHVSTFDLLAGALDTSSASWTASTWGMVTLNKRKCSVTTPTSIKQDTPIFVNFWFAQGSGSDQDILFVDHDFSVT